MTIQTQLLIGSAFEPGQEAKEPVLNPRTGALILEVPEASTAQVDRAVAAARKAFEGWSRTTPAARSATLLTIADRIDSEADAFAKLEALNCGKPINAARKDEIPAVVDCFRYFAGAVRCMHGTVAGEYLSGHTSMIRRDAVGVVASIAPWNYPLMMMAWKLGPAIAGGNTVVFKPSEQTPLTALKLAHILAEVLPEGVVNVVAGRGQTVGSYLINHPGVDMISLTGDVATGKKMLDAAAKTVKRTHLELGGKAPAVVFADADIAKTAEAIATAAFFNAGQDCTAATRLIVQAGVHDELVSELKRFVESTVTVGPDAAEPFYGPMNNDRQFASVLGVIERLPQHATIVTGGSRVGETGYFIAPTIVTGMRQDDEAVQEEIFGPVLTVQTFETESEALELANGVRYALAASVFTKDHGTAMRLTKRLDFGCVWVNTHIPFVSEMPHGGFKYSGYGKDLSMYGFEDYTRIKHVMHFLGE